MSSRNGLPTEVYGNDSRLSRSDSVWGSVAKPKPNLSNSGKRKSQDVDQHPVTKNDESLLPLMKLETSTVLDWLVSMYPVVL